MRTENELIIIAEQHEDDTVAAEAMKELRERFDPTYGWCWDCDGLVCKEKDCCMNMPTSPMGMICEHGTCVNTLGKDYKRKPKDISIGLENEPIFLCLRHSDGYEEIPPP